MFLGSESVRPRSLADSTSSGWGRRAMSCPSRHAVGVKLPGHSSSFSSLSHRRRKNEHEYIPWISGSLLPCNDALPGLIRTREGACLACWRRNVLVDARVLPRSRLIEYFFFTLFRDHLLKLRHNLVPSRHYTLNFFFGQIMLSFFGQLARV